MTLRLLFLQTGTTDLIRRTHNKHMNAGRAQHLLLVFVSSWLGATAVHAADAASPIGFWKGADGIFEMSENEGRLSAKIVALGEPNTPEGKEKTDICNPDPTKRDRPIIGLVFISGCTKKRATRWENGTVYDSKTKCPTTRPVRWRGWRLLVSTAGPHSRSPTP
jgi:hypothetical protein